MMQCNPDEAPVGYYAVPKSSLDHVRGNLCRQCDWRTHCQDSAVDLLATGNRCMGYDVVAARDGKVYGRADGCSVVFKRRLGAKND